MHYLLSEIAALTGGTVAPSQADRIVTGIASLEDAQPGDLAFFSNPKYIGKLRVTLASAVLVPLDFREDVSAALIRVENPSLAFAQIVEESAPPAPVRTQGVHPSAVVDPSARLGENVSIGPNVVIGPHVEVGDRSVICANSVVDESAVIGEDALLYSNVTIRERCILGRRVIIHAGAVIGSDGFGFETIGGVHKKIPQVGTVQIDDDVEIGANTTIDRARFGRTWIREGAKIDNLVQIAHNVTIGKHTLVIAQCGIAGSSRVGDHCTLAGQVGVVGHAVIGDHVIVAAQSGVTKDLPPNCMALGSPAYLMRDAKERFANVARLPRLYERVKALESQLQASQPDKPSHS